MKKGRKILLFKGKVETLAYFSAQLYDEFVKMGYDARIFNLKYSYNELMRLDKFIDEDTIVITFNFIGMNDEIPMDLSGLLFVNIIVDHPMYYYDNLMQVCNSYPKYIQCVVDKDHLKYMRRFYPEIVNICFLPLAGTKISGSILSNYSKNYDIVFTGNYSPPSVFDRFMVTNGEEYRKFYMRIIDDLIANPELEMAQTMEQHIREELGNISDDDINNCINKMMFIDMYVRFYYRCRVMERIAGTGYRLHIVGAGWDKTDIVHKSNVTWSGKMMNSFECLQVQSQAKISMNVMPWFKNGIHDRIFNSFLNGAVSVSDGSAYINEIFTNHKNIELYSLDNLDSAADAVSLLMENEKKLEDIREAGYEVSTNNTWAHRAHTLERIIGTNNG